MKKHLALQWTRCLVVAAQTLTLAAWAADADAIPRERLLMDYGWRFHLGDEWGLAEKLDKAGVNPGPAAQSFGDSGWRQIDLPHDWAIELPFDPYSSDTSHGFKPVGPGFHTNDVGWYRRTFALSESDGVGEASIDLSSAADSAQTFLP